MEHTRYGTVHTDTKEYGIVYATMGIGEICMSLHQITSRLVTQSAQPR